MFHFRHRTLIFIAGLTWFAVGVSLLPLGLRFIVESAQNSSPSLQQNTLPLPLLHFFAGWTGGLEQAAVFIVAVGLMVGFFKGRYVLSKSANRMINRIRGLPEPAPITSMYSLPYCILLGSMVFLGISIKYLGIPYDIRGLIDVAIGAALINGSMLYFRQGMSC